MRREIKKNCLNKKYEELYNERYNHQATNFFVLFFFSISEFFFKVVRHTNGFDLHFFF